MSVTYESGLLTRDYLFFTPASGCMFHGCYITLINLIVIAPLAKLNTELAQVGRTGLLSGRIKLGGMMKW